MLKIVKNVKKYFKAIVLSNMQCEFCGNWVSSEYILKTHKRTSKSCLNIQTQKGVTVKPLPFECTYCRKDFTSQQRLDTHLTICKSKPTHTTCTVCNENYMIGTDIEHKQTCHPKESVTRLPKEKSKPKKYPCVYCHKVLASQQNVNHHMGICKEKKALELAHSQKNATQQRHLEQNVKRMEEAVEEQIEQLTFEIRNTKEELEYELRTKDEKIKQLEQKLEHAQLVVHSGTSNHISHSNVTQVETMNNHYTTIFQYITPEVIKEAYQDYTIEQIKGGQKEFADVVRKSLINQHGQAGYICKDRSRKKCGYINESQEFVEDVQCNQLIQTSLPASIPFILESYKSSSEDEQSHSKKGLDDIMSLGKNNSTFVNQLCKTLPSNPRINDHQIVDSISTRVHDAKEEIKEFEEEERQFKMQQEEDLERERMFGYKEPVVRMIGGIRIGALDIFFKRYQRDGIVIVKPELQQLYESDETIRREYNDLIQNGMYHGDIVWSIEK
jgi:hypothetical protein